MIEIGFIGAIVVCSLIAISNWRLGLYLAIFMDVARDPVRKISESHSVFLTVAGTLIWGGVLLGAMNSDGSEIRSMLRRFPKLSVALQCLILSLLPGVALSLVMYDGGYKLVAIGLISYLGPLVGIAVGFVVPVKERDIYRVFKFYSVVNGIALIGTVFEAMGYSHPVLGGLDDMEWIRQQSGGLLVNLRAGIYRSPDIMGLHAAHVIVFSMMLGLRSRGVERICWMAMIAWGFNAVLLSGRRKMIGLPLVFIASYLGLGMWRGSRAASRLATLATLSAIGMAMAMFVMKSSGDVYQGNEYTQYAATLFTQGGGRAKELIGDSILVTVYQSGVLGSGIGSATQGSHYVAVKRKNAWQEDGASRLFKELGLPGVVLILFFAGYMFSTVRDAMNLIPPDHPLALKQIGVLSIVLGNAASFAISHQQYSGDPGSAILVVLMLGMVLGLPRIYFREVGARDRQRALELEKRRQAIEYNGTNQESPVVVTPQPVPRIARY